MKILKIFFLICILSYNHTLLKAQNDKNNNKIAINKLIFKADSLKEMGQLNYSINKYIKALKMDSNYAVLFYKIASAYALLKKKDSAFIFLEKTIKIDSSVNYLTNPDYFYLINEKKWDSIKKIKIEHFIKKDSSIKDINLAIKLWEIKLKDQSFYYFIKIDTANANRYWEIKDSINNKNIKQVDEIINNYGWPKRYYPKKCVKCILTKFGVDKTLKYLAYEKNTLYTGASYEDFRRHCPTKRRVPRSIKNQS